MKIQLPAALLKITAVLQSAGEEVYLVGGSLRDTLLGLEIHDYDLAGSASPEKIMALFPKVIPTGIKHGTVTIMEQGEGYEITTMRRDGIYKDGRHPEEVSFTRDIEADLARRDFTINAIAYRLPAGPLVDPFDGQGDLRRKVVRAVGNAEARFREDGLRLLRAARFAGKLSFSIEEKTYAALALCRDMLKNVSRERISNELCQIILGENPETGLAILAESGLLACLWPAYIVNDNHFQTLKNYPPDLVVRLSQLLRPCQERPAAIVTDLKLPTVVSTKILKLWELLQHEVPDTPAGQRAFRAANEDVFNEYLLLTAPVSGKLAALSAREPLYNDKSLAISSRELLQWCHLQPGPALGCLRRRLLAAVWEDPANNSGPRLRELAAAYCRDLPHD